MRTRPSLAVRWYAPARLAVPSQQGTRASAAATRASAAASSRRMPLHMLMAAPPGENCFHQAWLGHMSAAFAVLYLGHMATVTVNGQ